MSQFVINIKELQNLVSRSVKGAGNLPYSVITCFMHVELKDNVLSLTTTDGDNYWTVRKNDVSGDNMSFTVDVDRFSKLVSKTTSESVRISLTSDSISIIGNGTYKIPIQVDVDGSEIQYPEHEINSPDNECTIKTAVIKSIVKYNKPCLSTSLEKPYLTRYMCADDCVISGDEYNICENDVETFGTRTLIAPSVFDLLSMVNEEEIYVKMYENNILFETDTVKLFSVTVSDDGAYPVDRIKDYCSAEYPSDCVLPKSHIISAVDRLSLFIDKKDKRPSELDGIYMTFTKDGVKLESMNSDAIETISYQGSNNFKDYTCCIDTNAIRKQLVARSGESVHIYYGNPSTITVKDGSITQVIGLLNDPRFDDEDE